ncbi:MAG: hypothetical protein AAF607_05175 [Pseudomonadota bacterium]
MTQYRYIIALKILLCSIGAAYANDAYLALEEPVVNRDQAADARQLYAHDPSGKNLHVAVQALVRSQRAKDAWALVDAHQPVLGKAYFEARLAAINARLADASMLGKLKWARRLDTTCRDRLTQAPEDETALECLAKFHAQAPGIAGGNDTRGKAALKALMQLNLPRGLMVEAEITFPNDAQKALMLVDQALAYDTVYDEGLMQAAMIYGSVGDVGAAENALDRVDVASPVAVMRHYQLGKISAQTGARLETGEAALMTFLKGDTLYYGVDFRGPAHWRLGQIFAHGERYALAKIAFERALEHAPKLSAAQKDLKAIREKLRDRSS